MDTSGDLMEPLRAARRTLYPLDNRVSFPGAEDGKNIAKTAAFMPPALSGE